MKDSFEEQLRLSLQEGTEEASRMQEEVWEKISQRIAEDPPDAKLSYTPGARRVSPFWLRMSAGTVAAGITLTLFLSLAPQGQAFVEQVKTWFVPEKTVEETLEGISSPSDVQLQESTLGYVIYFDESRFRMERGEGADRIVPVGERDALYPEVYMEIREQTESPEAAAKALHTNAENEPTVLGPKRIEDPIDGWEIYIVGGTGGVAWNDPVTRYYVFSDEEGGSYVVKQQYFLEAEEGYGDRFKQMMKQFYILDKSDKGETIDE